MSEKHNFGVNQAPSMRMDFWLLGALAILLGLGLTMVFSSSIALAQANYDDSFAYFKRQLIAVGLGGVIAYITFYIPMNFWRKNRGYLLLLGYFLLISVLIIGTEINGSKRWLPLPFFNFQPSELMKLIAIIFMAGFLIKHHEEVNARFMAVIRLAIPFALMGVLLLLEPDFGATFVIMVVLAIMLLIAGAPLKYFLIILLPSSAMGAYLIQTADYRLARVQSFMDPWDDPFGSDYQLIQSLLAHGQGGWSGVGLGESVQKLSYLPEAHTDYIFSIFGEEFGVMGAVFLIALYGFIVYRIFLIGAAAMAKGHSMGGLVAYGIGSWIAVQSVINMSVTLGLAPSKGLTLPLFSYGGSSMLIFLSALAIVFRVDYEARHLAAFQPEPKEADNNANKDSDKNVDEEGDTRDKEAFSEKASEANAKNAKGRSDELVDTHFKPAKKSFFWSKTFKKSEVDKGAEANAEKAHKSGGRRAHELNGKYQQQLHGHEQQQSPKRVRSKKDFR